MWLFPQLLRHGSDESLRVCVPRALPQLQPPFGTCVHPSVRAGSNNPRSPPWPAQGGANQCMQLSYLKRICVLQSSLSMSWDMGSAHSEAAKLLWNHRDRYYPRAWWAEVRGDHPSSCQGTKTGCHSAAGLRLMA